MSVRATHYPKEGLEKIVLERKKESMHSVWIGQLVAKSLGGGIDSRKEIDLWLLQYVSKVKWRNPGEEAVLSPTPRCNSY